MGIRFHCPNGHKIHVKAEYAGKKAKCPHCSVKLVVPSGLEDSPQSPPSLDRRGQSSAALSGAGSFAPAAPALGGGASHTRGPLSPPKPGRSSAVLPSVTTGENICRDTAPSAGLPQLSLPGIPVPVGALPKIEDDAPRLGGLPAIDVGLPPLKAGLVPPRIDVDSGSKLPTSAELLAWKAQKREKAKRNTLFVAGLVVLCAMLCGVLVYVVKSGPAAWSSNAAPTKARV